MRRSISLRALVVLGVLAGCDLSEQLENQPCGVAKDCWHTQECARTPEEAQLGLPGLCLPKGTGCILGQQLGCGCEPDDYETDCTLSAAPIEVGYPEMVCDEARRQCVVKPEKEEP